jgi:PhzF family phenazine biosynthesis protein
MPHAWCATPNQEIDRQLRNDAKGLSRRCFLQFAPWISMALMNAARAGTGLNGATRTDEIEVVHTRVFAVGPNGGNRCSVIPCADRLSDRQMQSLARRFGFETTFILKPQSKAADIRLRYFVPDHEMGVSGHATIAGIMIAQLNNTLKLGPVRVETMTGTFRVESVQRKGGIVVTLDQNKPVFGPAVSHDLIARALKLDSNRIVSATSPIQSVSVSRAKLIVPLQNSKVLDSLRPDFDTLWELCERLQVSGFYPFTRQTDKPNVTVEARQFPFRAGFQEDAATGVAAAALGAYLTTYDEKCLSGRHLFRIAQGYTMGAPSLIEALAECSDGKITQTAIRGRCYVIGSEPIAL